MLPCLRVLTYCINGALEAPMSDGQLSRAFSESSVEIVRSVDLAKVLQVLLDVITAALYAENCDIEFCASAVSAVAAMSQGRPMLADKILEHLQSVCKDLILHEHLAVSEATQLLLTRLCSHKASHAVKLVTTAISSALDSESWMQQAANFEYALNVLCRYLLQCAKSLRI